jgi:hypothetical protein
MLKTPNPIKEVSILNLTESTSQEVFDFVINHLFTQKRQATSAPGNCVYMNRVSGDKCAAGCLIPEDKYIQYSSMKFNTKIRAVPESSTQQTGIETLPWCALIKQILAIENIQGDIESTHSTLINDLQALHDSFEVPHWLNKAISLAMKHGLNCHFLFYKALEENWINLDNLKSSTASEVVLYVAIHLFVQNQKATEQLSCSYLTTTGLRCAGGALITKPQLDEIVKKAGGTKVSAMNATWEALVGSELVPDVHSDLIKKLQHIHDNFLPIAWLDKLTGLAKLDLYPCDKAEVLALIDFIHAQCVEYREVPRVESDVFIIDD